MTSNYLASGKKDAGSIRFSLANYFISSEHFIVFNRLEGIIRLGVTFTVTEIPYSELYINFLILLLSS
jgi:hypothetical protein